MCFKTSSVCRATLGISEGYITMCHLFSSHVLLNNGSFIRNDGSIISIVRYSYNMLRWSGQFFLSHSICVYSNQRVCTKKSMHMYGGHHNKLSTLCCAVIGAKHGDIMVEKMVSKRF